MEKEILRKVQLVQLEILKEFRRVCEENDLSYFLESGTLLGAVRHKGFIPWDDDLDVSMKRKDYDKFLSIADSELSNKYELVTWNNEEEYAHPFAKLIKRGTVYRENKDGSLNNKCGIYIDIFPYDTFPNGRFKRLYQGFNIMLFRGIVRAKNKCKTWKTENGIDLKKYLKNLPLRVISKFFSRNYAIKRYEKICRKFNNEESDYLFINGCFKYGEEVHKCNGIASFSNYVFEDDIFKGPADFDCFLKELYGDYMKLPPIDKRENRHQIIELSFGDENVK